MERGRVEAGGDADVAAVVDDQFEGGRDDVLDGGDSRGDGADVDRQEGGRIDDRRGRRGARCA
jgi:hypothetical protein